MGIDPTQLVANVVHSVMVYGVLQLVLLVFPTAWIESVVVRRVAQIPSDLQSKIVPAILAANLWSCGLGFFARMLVATTYLDVAGPRWWPYHFAILIGAFALTLLIEAPFFIKRRGLPSGIRALLIAHAVSYAILTPIYLAVAERAHTFRLVPLPELQDVPEGRILVLADGRDFFWVGLDGEMLGPATVSDRNFVLQDGEVRSGDTVLLEDVEAARLPVLLPVLHPDEPVPDSNKPITIEVLPWGLRERSNAHVRCGMYTCDGVSSFGSPAVWGLPFWGGWRLPDGRVLAQTHDKIAIVDAATEELAEVTEGRIELVVLEQPYPERWWGLAD